jgi:phage gpG-like protein
MPVAFRISSYGMEDLVTGFDQLGRELQDFTECWPAVRQSLAGAFAMQFRTEGAHGPGKRWNPLSERYARWKARHYPGRKILELTYRLRDSLTSPGDPDEVVQESARSLWVGTAVPYAQYHQYGKGRRLRPIVALTARDAAGIGAAVHRKVDKDVHKFSLINRMASQRARVMAGAR